MKTKQPTTVTLGEVDVVGTGAAQEVDAATSVIEHADPKSGGSYVRDPDTGALIKTAGPATNEQPEQE